MNLLRKFAFFLVVTVLLAACETLPPPQPVAQPEQTVTVAQIKQALAAQQGNIQNVKSLVKTSIKTNEHNHTLKQILLIDNETSLRLDTLSTFGQVLAVLISDRESILLFDVENNRFYKDAEVWDIMVRQFGTVFDFREYISVLSGKIPGLDALQLQELEWNAQAGRYDVSAFDFERDEQLRISVDPKTLLPARLAKWKNKQHLYTVYWENYQGDSANRFPHTITVERPERGDSVTLQFNNPLINQGMPEGAFQLGPPDES